MNIMTNRKHNNKARRLSGGEPWTTTISANKNKNYIWFVARVLLIPSIFAIMAIIIIYSLFYKREGFTYQPYQQPTTATVEQNGNNIQFIKDELDKLNKQVVDMSGNIVTLNEQVKGISQASASQADALTNGNQPINVSTAT